MSKAARRIQDMAKDEINAFLGVGTSYEGKLQFQGSVRIDGTFTGEIVSEGTLIVGREAHVRGTITVGQLILSGQLHGDIRAAKKVMLHKTANLVGGLATPVLGIEEGAVMEGQVSMGADESTAAALKQVQVLRESGDALPAGDAEAEEVK